MRGTGDDVHQARAGTFDALDLLPEAYREELAKLQDEVAPLPANAIAEVIREDLGGPTPCCHRL